MSGVSKKQTATWTGLGCAGVLALSTCAVVPLVLVGVRQDYHARLSEPGVEGEDERVFRPLELRAAAYAQGEGARAAGSVRRPEDGGELLGQVRPRQVWLRGGPHLALLFPREEVYALMDPKDGRALWVALGEGGELQELSLAASSGPRNELQLEWACTDLAQARARYRALIEAP